MSSSNVVAIALQNLKNLAASGTDPKVDQKYLDGLVRVQPDGTNRGSFVEEVDSFEKTQDLLTQVLEFEEKFEADLPPTCYFFKARYFHAQVPCGMTARTGVLTFGQLTDEQRANVQLVAGAHGPELMLPWSGPLAETRDIWVITGKEDELFWTWYPGPVTPRMTEVAAAVAERVIAGETVSDDELKLVNPLAVKLQLS